MTMGPMTRNVTFAMNSERKGNTTNLVLNTAKVHEPTLPIAHALLTIKVYGGFRIGANRVVVIEKREACTPRALHHGPQCLAAFVVAHAGNRVARRVIVSPVLVKGNVETSHRLHCP